MDNQDRQDIDGAEPTGSSPQPVKTLAGRIPNRILPGDADRVLPFFSARRFMIITIGGIFLAEVVAMIVLVNFSALPYFLQTLLDASIMIILIFPLVYYFSLRPLLIHIEKRKQAEDKLRKSEERFIKAFHFSPAALSITRVVDGGFIDVNESFLRIHGSKREEVIGHTSIELGMYIKPDEREEIKEQTLKRRSLAQDGVRNYEMETSIRSGETRTVLISTEAIELEGEPCILTSVSDITERKRTETHLRRVNRALSVLNGCNQLLVRAEHEIELMQRMCEIIVNIGGYQMAWVGLAEQDATRSVRPVVQSGFEDGYLGLAHITWAENEQGHGPTGTAIREGSAQVNQNFLTNPKMEPWRASAISRGYQSSIALPLINEGSTFGALTIYSTVPDAFDPDEVKLLTELANDLAFGITALHVRTERNQAQELIREMALFPTLNPDAVIRVDANGRIEKTNPAAGQMGLQVNAQLTELVPGLREIDLHAIIATGTGEYIQQEARLGENIFLWTVRGAPELGLAFLYGKNINERKRAEAAIRQLSSIVEQTEDTVVVTDRTGVIEYVNPAFERLTGYTREEALGKTPNLLKSGIHDNQFYQGLWKTILNGGVFQAEMANRKKNGDLFYEVKTISPLRDSQGEITHFAATGKDITQHKRDEEKLRKAYDELELRVRERTYELKMAVSELEAEVAERKKAEEALRASEARFRLSLKNAPVSVAAQDRDLRFLWAYNQRTVNPGTVIGKTDMDLFPPEDAAHLVGLKHQVLETEKELREQLWITSGGRKVFLDLFIEPQRDETGQVTGIGIATVDLTPMKLAEEALRKNEATLRGILDATTESIWLFSPDGTVLMANETALLRLHKSAGEVIGENFSKFMPTPELAKSRQAYLREVTETGEPLEVMEQYAGITFHHTYYPVKDTDVHVTQVVAFSRDITARKQAEEALLKSERRLSRAQEIAHLGSWELDLPENRLTWSDEVYRIFGLQPQEFDATYETFLNIVHPDDRAAVDDAYSSSIREGRDSYEIEHRITRQPSGEIRSVREKCEHIRNEAGQIILSVGMVHDITERKQIEVALQQRNEELEAARFAAENERRRLEAVMEALPVGVAIIDIHGGNVKANYAFEMLWGERRVLPRSDSKYASYTAWWAGTGAPVSLDEWASVQVISKGTPVIGQMMEIQRFDGSHVFVINSASPVRDSNGKIVGSAVAIQDVTALREAEQLLRKANGELELRVRERTEELVIANRELLNEIAERKQTQANLQLQTTALEAAANGVIITDTGGRILWANPAFLHMSGYRLVEVVGQTPHLLYSGKQEDPFYSDLWTTILKGDTWRGELLNRRKDGSLYSEEQTITPVRDENGQIAKFIAIAQDVTEEYKQRRMTGALIQASIALNTSLKLEEVLDEILRQIQRVLVCQAAVIILTQNGRMDTVRQIGFHEMPDNISTLSKGFSTDSFSQLERVNHSNQPLLGADLQADPGWPVLPGLEWIRSYIVAPICVKEERIGYIIVVGDKPGFFVQENVDDLMAFTNHALTAIHNAQLYAAEQSARQTAEILGAATHALTQSINLESVINTLLNYIAGLVPSDSARVSLLENNNTIRVHAWRRFEDAYDLEKSSDQSLELDANPVLNSVVKTQKSLLIPDTEQYPEWRPCSENDKIRNWLGVPIITGDHAIGLVELGQTQRDFFTPGHIQWAEALVTQAAVAIQNAWLFEQVRSGREHLQSLSRRLVEIQETERRDIARELHDQAGQSLTSLMLDLGILEKEAEKPDRVRTRVGKLKELTTGILEELHRLAVNLRPVSLDQLGLVAALKQLVKSLGARTQIQLKFKAVGINEYDRLPPDIETALYRIAQEALTNVTRHSHASRADVLLEKHDNVILLVVEDNGAGFSNEFSRSDDHLGLLGIQERAETLGGKLTIESTPDQGTTLVVEVPYANSHPTS